MRPPFRSRVISTLGPIGGLSKSHGCLVFHGFTGNNITQIDYRTAVEIVLKLHRKIPNKFQITFDDAYEDIEVALNEWVFLRKPIKVFLSTGWIGKDFLHGRVANINTLRRWANFNHVELHSHGHTHTNFTRLENNSLKKELEESRKIIEELTGKKSTEIAYPRGKYSPSVIETLEQLNFDQAWTTDRGLHPNLKSLQNRMSLPRISVSNYSTPKQIYYEFSKIANMTNQMLKHVRQ
jgi:hypothetical protein